MNRALRLAVAIAAAATVVVGHGQDGALTQADAAFVAAVTDRDRAALENLLDTDFTWTGADGAVQSRSEILRQLPKTAIESEKDAESRVFSYRDLADIQVNQGRSHVLRVWVKRSGRRKVIMYQEVISLSQAVAECSRSISH